MGLTEKRKIQELTNDIIPARTQELHEIIGTNTVAYEVDWASFETFDELNFVDNLTCHRINMAFRMICTDDIGKQAVQEGLKLIKVKNVKSMADKSMTFKDGVLDLASCYAEKLDGIHHENDIKRLVEAGL